MDWGDLAGKLLGMGLPSLGTALGGPLGGVAGKILADAIGVDNTPDAVNDALSKDPAAIVAAKAAEQEWAKTAGVYAQAAADQGKAINETMRSEIAAGSPWYHWRNTLGHVTVFSIAGFGVCVGKDLWSNDFNGVQASIHLVTAITPILMAIFALLGYVAQDSTKLKNVAITGTHSPSVIGNLIGGLIKKK